MAVSLLLVFYAQSSGTVSSCRRTGARPSSIIQRQSDVQRNVGWLLRGQIYSDCRCCQTETCSLSRSQCTEIGPTSPSSRQLPGCQFLITRMSRPGKALGSVPVSDRLFGLMVNSSSSSRAEDPGFDSYLRRGDFSGSSHTSDLKVGTPVTILPGAWRYRVIAGTGWTGVRIL